MNNDQFEQQWKADRLRDLENTRSALDEEAMMVDEEAEFRAAAEAAAELVITSYAPNPYQKVLDLSPWPPKDTTGLGEPTPPDPYGAGLRALRAKEER